jgi:hypothetical protein
MLPRDAPVDFNNIIENFLGPEICNSQLVRDCILSEEEAAALDSDFTLLELDTAAGEGKVRSASGIDGFSNGFIKKFWKFFRAPLLAYMNTCFGKKELTDNFRTASVRLIPKKGDLSLIKNWRPISLLNCFYKVISRAVNNRLKKITDRITSRAQKGFNKSRYLQEVILNISQNISFCRSNDVPAAVISIDQAKAFDTIYHRFVRVAYRFFEIKEKFLDIMDTLGTGRMSRIIFDDGTLSRCFNLETGRPQGDCPSPLQFNAGDQILLFKVELDPDLESVYSGLMVPRCLFPVNIDEISINFRNECNAETDKADCLADDTTVCIRLTRQGLYKLKQILEDFSKISGLKCNFDKTCVIPINCGANDRELISQVGFKIVENVTLLGFRLDENGPMTEIIFQDVYRKICNIIAMWDRYKLSLPCRIGIFKSLLLSQVSFHGSILRPSTDTVKKIQAVMNNYVIGNLRVSKDRLYTDPGRGGLGLIDLDQYLIGLHVSWIKKANHSTIDNWRTDLRSVTYGNPLISGPAMPGIRNMPILRDLACNYEKFSKCFYNKEGNFKDAFVLQNKFSLRMIIRY